MCNYKYNVLQTCTQNNHIAYLSAPVTIQNCMAYCQSKCDCASFFFWNVSSTNNGCHLYSASTSQCADTSTPVSSNAGFYERACDVSGPRCDYKYNVRSTCTQNNHIAYLSAPVAIQNCMAYCQSKSDCGSFLFWNVSSTNNGCHLYSASTAQCADTSTPVTGNAGFYDRTCDVCACPGSS
jgi:hypothetical protein